MDTEIVSQLLAITMFDWTYAQLLDNGSSHKSKSNSTS